MSSKWVLVSHSYQGAREALEAGFRGVGYHTVGVVWPREAPLLMEQNVPPLLAVIEVDPERAEALELVALLCRAQPRVPVVAVSGNTMSLVAQQALQLGAHAVLARPTTARDVLAALETETPHAVSHRLIKLALAQFGGKKAAAARFFGVDLTGLRRKSGKSSSRRRPR